MKKSVKSILIVLVVLAVVGLCIGGYFIWRHNSMYISKNEAIDIAVNDAGLSRTQVYDIDAEFEKSHGQAWYDVDFNSQAMEYEYVIDAVNGSVLRRSSSPD